MKNKILILYLFVLTISCTDNPSIVVSESYYNELKRKADSLEKAKPMTRQDSIAPYTIKRIGKHDFLEYEYEEISSSHVYSFTHDPECSYCKTKNK